MLKTTRNLGFTLIELLVVISIIGLLSTIVLDSLTKARTQAQAARIASDFRTIKTAFILLADDEKVTSWWNDNTAQPTGFGVENPTIASLSANTSRLGKYLPTAPTPPIGTGEYIYDYDNNTFVCGAYNGNGAQIALSGVPDAVILALDGQMDKGDGSGCGKIIWYGSDVRYMLGYSGSDMIN